jgi:RNA polymerase sigma factor (sigma-70 family)
MPPTSGSAEPAGTFRDANGGLVTAGPGAGGAGAVPPLDDAVVDLAGLVDPAPLDEVGGEVDEWAVLARRAAGGDRAALEQLCRRLQHPVYRLALRMTGHPHDAADAAQEAMIRIITRLGSFEGRSSFMTWAYTVAARQLLTTRKREVEASVRGAQAFAAFLDTHRHAAAAAPEASPQAAAEFAELCADIRLGCTSGMLLCLTRPVRLAYLLGDLLGMPDTDGAAICGTTPAAYRQRLARARRTMRTIMSGRCGLIRETNPCRCSAMVRASIEHHLTDPARPAYARHPGVEAPVATGTLERAAAQLDQAVAIAEVYRADPTWLAPAQVWAGLQRACPDLLGATTG